MSIVFDVEPYHPSVADAYLRLFPGDTASKSRELLQWRFGDCPHGTGLFALARDCSRGGLIVGMIGLIATRIRAGSRYIDGLQAIDTMVDPAYRGQGLFVGMAKAAYARVPAFGRHFIWGFPNANAAPGWFGKLGWTHHGPAPFLVRPLRTGYFLGRVHAGLKGFDVSLTRQRTLDAGTPICDFDEQADSLWAEAHTQLGYAVDRSAKYLNWRLFQRPGARYDVQGVFGPGGELLAFCAGRTVQKHGAKIAYVMEALARPGHSKTLSGLLRRQLAQAAGRGAELALAWCPPGSPVRSTYTRAGFLRLPERVRPVEIHVGYRFLDKSAPPECSATTWHISYLDSDTI